MKCLRAAAYAQDPRTEVKSCCLKEEGFLLTSQLQKSAFIIFLSLQIIMQAVEVWRNKEVAATPTMQALRKKSGRHSFSPPPPTTTTTGQPKQLRFLLGSDDTQKPHHLRFPQRGEGVGKGGREKSH